MDNNEILFYYDGYTEKLRTWNGFQRKFNPPIYYTYNAGRIIYGPNSDVDIKAYDISLDNQGYHQLTLDVIPNTFRVDRQYGFYTEYKPVENLIAIVDSVPTETIAKRAVYVNAKNHHFTTDCHERNEQWFISKVSYKALPNGHDDGSDSRYIVYCGFKVLMPVLQEILPITMSYESTYRLTGSGSVPALLTLSNPFAFSVYGKMDTDDTYSISTNLTTATAQYNFTSDDIGERTYTIKFNKTDVLDSDETLYYFYDQFNTRHSFCQGYKEYGATPSYYKRKPYFIIDNDTIEYQMTVVDNSDIFKMNSANVEPVRTTQHTSTQYYLTNTGAIKLSYSFSYSAGANTYRLRLYDKSRSDGTTFIEKSFSSSAATISEVLYSDTLTKIETVNLVLEITDNFNRIISYDFGLVSIREYSRPKIHYFDAYFSKTDGSLDLQSTHMSALTSFSYSALDGTNLLQQEMTIKGGDGSVIATIDPDFTDGARKYFNNITLPQGSAYEITFTISDTMGNSASITFELNRSGNVLMDFNNTGFGLAIGKISEENNLEINLPTVFYNDVEYVNGARQTADAASVLGCMDTYNVGVRTIQAALDYAISKLI